MTTVACSSRAPGARNVYYTWVNTSAHVPTRTWVRDMPNPVGLSGLADFLARHVYNTSHQRGALMVRVYNDQRTEADVLRDADPTNPNLENIIRVYELDKAPASINDWAFPLAGDDETPEAFWQRAADGMLAAGATRVAVDIPGRARVQWESGITEWPR